MKRILSLFLTLVMALSILTSVPVTARAASTSDLTFEKMGDGTYFVTDCKESVSGEVIIPSKYKGKTVGGIGWAAFAECKKITSLIIPDSVTYIDGQAFENCTSLKKLIIPNSVTTIRGAAFYGFTGLEEITLSENIDGISYNVFDGCKNLKKIIIPNKVEFIAEFAFYGCENLTSVVIGSKVKTIYFNCFFNCKKLKSVTIPKTVKNIADGAFGYYTNDGERSIKIKGFTIYGFSGSAAEKYATDNGFKFVNINTFKKIKPTLKKITNTTSGVKITWGKVTGAQKYNVYRKVSGGEYKYIGATSNTYYTDKTAKSGTKYYYAIRGKRDGIVSSQSASLSKLYLADPTLKTPSSTTSGIKLSWSKVTGAQGYIIYRKTGSGSYTKLKTEKGVSNLSYVDKSAKKGKKYTYKVKAYKSKTYSAYSNTKTITDKY